MDKKSPSLKLYWIKEDYKDETTMKLYFHLHC